MHPIGHGLPKTEMYQKSQRVKTWIFQHTKTIQFFLKKLGIVLGHVLRLPALVSNIRICWPAITLNSMVKRFLLNIFVHDVINLWYHKIPSKENSLGHCCRCHILYILQIIVIKRPNNHHSSVQNTQYVFHVYCHYRETLIH